MFVLGALISILCSVWYYRTAIAKGAPAIQWAFVGFISYFLTNFVWTFWVSKPIATKFLSQNRSRKAGMVSASGIIIGALVAWLIWYQILNKLKKDE